MAEAVGHPQQPQAAEEGHGGAGGTAEAVAEDGPLRQAHVPLRNASACNP